MLLQSLEYLSSFIVMEIGQMDAEIVKYSRIEYERRFVILSSEQWKHLVEPYSKRLQDKYIMDSRIRIRILTDSDTDRQIIKLTKKFDSESPYFRRLCSILLSSAEYHLFEKFSGKEITKVRHYHIFEEKVFSIDVFEGELAGLVICECEADSLNELMKAIPPSYVTVEVTEDNFFTGGHLANVTQENLKQKLSTLCINQISEK